MNSLRSSRRDTSSPRLRRPSWRNPRLVIGLFIVLASVLAVVGVVRASDTTRVYLVARHDLTVGEKITLEDLEPAHLNLGQAGDLYVDETDRLAEEAVSTQAVAAGQVVPKSSIGTRDRLNRKPMTLSVSSDRLGGVSAGRTVDVWIARSSKLAAATQAPAPVRAVSGAEVLTVRKEDTGFGSGSRSTVQVLVPEKDLPSLIRATADESEVTLVPAYGTRS